MFAFDLAQTGLDGVLDHIKMPGTRMIPVGCAVRSSLALKLSRAGCPSQVMAEMLDPGLVRFTGLNIISGMVGHSSGEPKRALCCINVTSGF